MEDKNYRVKKLRAYLMNVISTIVSSYEQLNIDFLGLEAGNFSLDKIPTETITEKWIIGSNVYQDTFSFRSRKDYSEDVMNNIKNIGFFETFEKTIKDKNDKKQLPDITGIESIECLNCGSVANANGNTAELDIQIRIKYREV